MFDLDHFSDVNNEHGHAVGDAVLRRVARAMASAVRTGDVVARYGGEEFVIIAPGASQDDAVRLAERIRIRVTHEARDAIDGLVVPLTISAGVASRLGDEVDGRGLFRAADSALLHGEARRPRPSRYRLSHALAWASVATTIKSVDRIGVP